MHRLLVLSVTILVGFCAPSLAAQNLLIEWADRPGNQEWMGNDPVFQRTLSCWSEGQREICKLTVVTIGRKFCPAVLITDAFRTDTNDLKVSRTPNAVDMEFVDISNTWTIHLKLTGDKYPIVEQMSGVVVTQAVVSTDRLRSSELVALVSDRVRSPTREFVDVDLKCPKIAVVAAKREAK